MKKDCKVGMRCRKCQGAHNVSNCPQGKECPRCADVPYHSLGECLKYAGCKVCGEKRQFAATCPKAGQPNF